MSSEVFDEPSRWRADAVVSLGLRGEELAAGVSTGVAYPLALGPIVRALDLGPGRRVLDVGAGLGGVAWWIAERTGAGVIALEPEAAAVAGARRLFPHLPVVRAGAADLPVGAGRLDAVTLLGVVSLVGDLLPLLAEVARVLRPGGAVGVSDLCLADGAIARPHDSPNTFRSMGHLVAQLERSGFHVVELAAGDADAAAGWNDVARRVDDEIARGHGDSAPFAAWSGDRRRLRDAIDADDLHVVSLVATHPG